jgi:hypothetical protein
MGLLSILLRFGFGFWVFKLERADDYIGDKSKDYLTGRWAI